MAATGKKKGTSAQTYRYSSRLAIRLEYDQGDERQSVFLNNELRSSFHCPTGFRVEHSFRGDDAISEGKGYWGEWSIKFAVEQNTFRIRYELLRRSTGGDDTKWYRYDWNVEPDGWARFPEFNQGEQVELECEECGATLRCAECNPPQSATCQACRTELQCPRCIPQVIYDSTLMRVGLNRRAIKAGTLELEDENQDDGDFPPFGDD